MRSLIDNRPLLCAAFCLGTGIYLGIVAGCPVALWGLCLILLGLGWVIRLRRQRVASTICAMLLLFLIGAGLASYQRDGYFDGLKRLQPLIGESFLYSGLVTEEAYWSQRGWRVPVRIQRIAGNSTPPFDVEWRLAVTGTPPPPGSIVQLQGRWAAGFLEGLPAWRERKGLLGFIKTDNWLESGSCLTLQRRLFLIKRRLERVGEQTLSKRSADVLHGMLFGEEIMETELNDDFRRSGVIHLLSVGGLHIGFLAALLAGLGLALRIPRRLVLIGVLVILPFFILMVGGKPPVVRAGVISSLVIIGFLLEKPVDGLNLWGAAAFIMLLIRPLDLFDPGFQLSFGASAGLLWLFPRWRKVVPDGIRPLTDPIWVSLTAQVGVLPFLALYFGNVAWVGLVANLLIVPLSTIMVQLGALAAILGQIWPLLAILINTSNEWILKLILLLIKWFSDLNGQLPLPPVNGWGVLLYYGVLLAIVGSREVNPITREHRIPQRVQMTVVFLMVIALTGWGYAQSPPDHLRIELLDVGQGDSIVVTAPGGKRMLIDGGSGESYEDGLHAYIRQRMIRRFDVVVLTHAHEDHVGGLAKLLESREITVGQILDPGVPHSSKVYERFLRAALGQKIPYAKARRGMTIHLGNQVNAQVLWPAEGAIIRANDLNHGSIVLRLNYKQQRVLLMGDADAEAEREMLGLDPAGMRARVLKVGHHGSAYSSCAEFLAAVKPRISLISVGKGNSFGHPNRKTMNRLRKVGTLIIRTDKDGRITLDFINATQVKVRRGNP